MTIVTLTPEQSQALQREGNALRVVDPATKSEYVLVRAEIAERLPSIFGSDDENFAAALYDETMKTFGRHGWEDAAMDIYNQLDPRKA